MQITNEYNRPMRTLGLDRRSIWATVRCSMEADNYKQKLNGGRRRHHWRSFETLLKVFALGLKVTSLYDRGIANARALELRCHDVPLKNLPQPLKALQFSRLPTRISIRCRLSTTESLSCYVKKKWMFLLSQGIIVMQFMGNFARYYQQWRT